MPRLEYLKVKAGDVLTPQLWNSIIDLLEALIYEHPVSLNGYVRKDLMPVSDLGVSLGLKDLRFKHTYTGYLWYTYGVYYDPLEMGNIIRQSGGILIVLW